MLVALRALPGVLSVAGVIFTSIASRIASMRGRRIALPSCAKLSAPGACAAADRFTAVVC